MTAIEHPKSTWLAGGVTVSRTLLTVLATLLYVVGWVPGGIVTGAGWVVAAIQLGWHDARRTGERT